MYNSTVTTVDTTKANITNESKSYTHILLDVKTISKKALGLASKIIKTPFRVQKSHVSGCGYVYYLTDVLGVNIGTIRKESKGCVLALNKAK
jgi:hypothetical protein